MKDATIIRTHVVSDCESKAVKCAPTVPRLVHALIQNQLNQVASPFYIRELVYSTPMCVVSTPCCGHKATTSERATGFGIPRRKNVLEDTEGVKWITLDWFSFQLSGGAQAKPARERSIIKIVLHS